MGIYCIYVMQINRHPIGYTNYHYPLLVPFQKGKFSTKKILYYLPLNNVETTNKLIIKYHSYFLYNILSEKN